MAGTILHRIISRPKMAPLQTDRSTHTIPQINSTDMLVPTPQKISFEEPTESRKSSAGEISMPSLNNMRKHSYASVREESDLPQTFHLRKPSSESSRPIDYLPRRLGSLLNLEKLAKEADNEEAILDSDSDVTPYSYDGTTSDFDDEEEEIEVQEKKPTSLEDLPDEVLDQIFSMIQLDVTQDNYLCPKVDLFACLLVSKPVHEAALRVLYKHVLIYRSKTFHKLVTSVEEDPALGRLIRTLDFSHYSHMGYGRSRGQTNTTPYLTKENLKLVLQQTTGLKNFLVHEHLDDEIDQGVLSTLFSIPSLRSVDFTSCSSTPFVNAFSNLWLNSSATQYSQVKRLCLHECTTLKPAVFESILPRLTQVTHLDLAHTKVNDTALMAISSTARITHLNLERCTQITGDGVVDFLTEHPAAQNLVWLNLNADASRYRLLSSEDVDRLLPALPRSLRSLNLGGARISSQHVPALQLLATQLEELGIKGANLSLGSDIVQILSLIGENGKPKAPNMNSSLRYIDLTDISSVTQMSLNYSPISIKDKSSLPLEVIELSGTVLTEIARRNKNIKNPEWTVKELGRRGWYVRAPESFPADVTSDDGYRRWKMGARWWGMRKIPMVEQEVGGMYGYFMFKRN